ncbi:MAG: ABC transporter permease [Chloroflexi bacterium]|nr:ABC transporter permease [Chloroflexota bacterium]MBA3739889.1 ABC transporter permease [Chloroflexota bacterium]
MSEAISNIWRRPLRTALTILGIVIGVFALTVMGALAEKLNVLVDGGDEYFRTRLFVFDQGAASGFQASARPITRDMVERIEELPGVDRATPVLQTLLDPEQVGGFDIPELLTGIEPETWYDPAIDLPLDAGRLLEPNERGVTFIGADLAERYDLRVGDSFTMRGSEFEVIGVLERTLTFPDKIAYVPLADAQAIYVESVPDAFEERTSELATQIEVFPEDLSQANAIAAAIEEGLNRVRAVTPEQVADQIGQASIVFNLIIIGASVIAVIVGGLSVINTMVMTVTERVREIGIKKAVGAPTGAILREFVIEATLLGAIGGVIGVSAGALLVLILNAQTAGSGTSVFLLTPMLLLRSFLFATILGALAGIYPAFRAARLDPVTALRST